jgi:hypothetical protein
MAELVEFLAEIGHEQKCGTYRADPKSNKNE